MLTWQQRGAAVVSPITLVNGDPATVAVVGSRSNPKGAALFLPGGAKGGVTAVPLSDALDRVHPAHLIETLALQERLHGSSGLEPPENLNETT